MADPVLSQFHRRAMATEFVVMLPGLFGKHAELALEALEQVEAIESQLSIYRPASDISRLNQAAGVGPVNISQDCLAVLQQAQELSRQTHGAFDVTAGPLVQAWGFTQRRGQKPTPEAIAQALSKVGFDRLRLDAQRGTAELLEPGMSLNLGAIGKGFALERIASVLRAGGATDFLVHGGKSSVIAAGDDVPGSDSGWKVAIEHPLIRGRRLGGLRLRNEALATSGSGSQFFHHQGKRLGHVIDPRTGWPAGDLLSLTIVHPSATAADALATGLFVSGLDQGLRGFDGGWVAVQPTGRQADVVVRHGGLREDAWIHDPAD